MEALAAKITPPIDLHGETLNADFSDSEDWILKLKTESNSAREELSNDMQHDYVEMKDSCPKWQKRKGTLNTNSLNSKHGF